MHDEESIMIDVRCVLGAVSLLSLVTDISSASEQKRPWVDPPAEPGASVQTPAAVSSPNEAPKTTPAEVSAQQSSPRPAAGAPFKKATAKVQRPTIVSSIRPIQPRKRTEEQKAEAAGPLQLIATDATPAPKKQSPRRIGHERAPSSAAENVTTRKVPDTGTAASASRREASSRHAASSSISARGGLELMTLRTLAGPDGQLIHVLTKPAEAAPD
jgi:hypothetical protein